MIFLMRRFLMAMASGPIPQTPFSGPFSVLILQGPLVHSWQLKPCRQNLHLIFSCSSHRENTLDKAVIPDSYEHLFHGIVIGLHGLPAFLKPTLT